MGIMKSDKIKKEIKNALKKQPKQSLAHRMDHFERVKKDALEIAKNYDCDEELLSVACLLHDIDQPFDDKEGHVERSLKRAEEILTKLNYKNKNKVIEIIREHSTENITDKKSIESKILFDADKIDGLGPKGIARVFLLMGQQGRTMKEAVEWYKDKIDKSLGNLQTEEGKEMFKRRLKYTENFLESVEKNTT